MNATLRNIRLTASVAVLCLGVASVARAEDAVDHSKMDHSGHGAAASTQWADPGKSPSGAGQAEANKPDEHSGHHGGGMMGGMMGGMGGGSGGMGSMMGGDKMGGTNHGAASGGTSHGGGVGSMMKHMMCGFTEHLEGRLAYLKAELKLTDSQAGAWNNFADAWRAAAQKAAPKCEASDARKDPAKPPVLGKLEKMESHMVDHLDIVRAQKAAIEPLFTALSDEQKKIASETFTTMMKVGMSMGGGGMGGMMRGGSGGMQH